MRAEVCCVAVSNYLASATNCGTIAAALTQEASMREKLSLLTTGVVFAFLGAIVIGII